LIPDFKSYIRNWPGNRYSDLTHLLAQPPVFPALAEALASPFAGEGVTKVAAVESGGLALGGGVAHRLGAGLVLIRKAGKIAWEVEMATCRDWSGAEKKLEMARDAASASDRVLVMDDWSETGGQLKAAVTLVERLGATVVGAACLHIGPPVRQDPRLAGYRLHHLIEY
jgi:adenine phosphoribosyltransferase